MNELFEEDELLPISALQHLMFCERQYALIHLEQLWEENRLTAEGNQLHEKVDTPETETRKNLKIVRSLRLRSLKWGLTGVADVVEFHFNPNTSIWHPYPIEYKRGKPKKDLSDAVQLCAQVLCLEEMLNVEISNGSFFYGEPKRRSEIAMDEVLRNETKKLINKLHELAKAKKTPPAIYTKKCENCSLINLCMPKTTNGSKIVKDYLIQAKQWVEEIL